MTERGVLGATTKQFRVFDQRRAVAVDRDPMVSGSLPGGCDRRSQIGRQGSTFDEFLPRGSHFPLVHFGTSNATRPAPAIRRAQRSITPVADCPPPRSCKARHFDILIFPGPSSIVLDKVGNWQALSLDRRVTSSRPTTPQASLPRRSSAFCATAD